MWNILALGLVRGGLFALMAVGLALQRGVLGVANFAHGEFYMLGAYAGYFASVTLGLPPPLAILGGTALGFAAGAICERVVFRPLRVRAPAAWMLDTMLLGIGLSYCLKNGAQLVFGVRTRAITYYWRGSLTILPGVSIAKDRMAAVVIAVVAISALWLFLTRTQTGRAIRAVAQNGEGAQLVGIDLDRIHLLTFALSSALAGLAGAAALSTIPAYPTVGASPNLKSWYVMILTGLGNVGGAIIGGFVIGLFEAGSYYFLGGSWQDVLSLCLIILVLIVKPSGIFGSQEAGGS